MDGTFGTRTWGTEEPMQAGDHFRIGSNTKTLTSTVILQLAQEGKLSLDDPIDTYIPGVPNGDKITIRNLSEMRSGLYSYSFDTTVNNTLDQQPQKIWTPQELIDIEILAAGRLRSRRAVRLQQHQYHPARHGHRKADRADSVAGVPGADLHPARPAGHLAAAAAGFSHSQSASAGVFVREQHLHHRHLRPVCGGRSGRWPERCCPTTKPWPIRPGRGPQAARSRPWRT